MRLIFDGFCTQTSQELKEEEKDRAFLAEVRRKGTLELSPSNSCELRKELQSEGLYKIVPC